MAQQDDEKDDGNEELDSEVEGSEEQDENEEDQGTDDDKSDDEGQAGDEETEDDSEDEDDSDEEESDDEEDEDDSELEQRIPRFKADTPQEYIRKVEDGYKASTAEALKLKRRAEAAEAEREEWKQKAMASVAKDDKSEGAESTDEEEIQSKISEHPAIKRAEAQRDQAFVKQFREFADEHPMVDDQNDDFDEVLFEQLNDEVGLQAPILAKKLGRDPELSEVLEVAWKLIGPEDSKEDKVTRKLKEESAGSTNKSAKKGSQKPQFTPQQIENARKMDPGLADKSDAEVEKVLAKYQ